ncbi:MAG: efflux RND transporter permease subunit [Kiritimatiellae bacterium]|nr:efflux RND transporter permease subunit [Kiritimatiellia bacterium]
MYALSVFRNVARHPKTVLLVLLLGAALGVRTWQGLAVDVFPDISVPRVTIQTEAGGLTAEEVEQLVTIPIETAVNGIPGVSTIRSSSGGGLSFVWVDFDWNVDLARARFDVFERLARVRESLPAEAEAEIAPVVSVTGEIMLVALTAKEGGASPLELRELAEYDLRTRLLGIPGIGEVAVIGGRLPEYCVAVDPRRLAEHGLGIAEVVEATRDTRTALSAGYLPNVAGEEIPLRQLARADTLAALRKSPIPLASGSLRLGDVAEVSLAGAPRRGSASFGGKDAVVLSVQKAPGGNTPALTRALEKALAEFGATVENRGVEVHVNAYRQADFIGASIKGGGEVVRDAVIVVAIVLLVTLLELRTLLVVLISMPITILLGLVLFPVFGLGVNVMTLGGFAVAAGDIVDAAIIFTEVIRRRLGENAALPENERRSAPTVIAEAAVSVAPGVLFSTVIVVLVFLPLLMLSGLEGQFFRPLGLAYLCVFAMSLVSAWVAVPALSCVFRLDRGFRPPKEGVAREGLGIRVMKAVYRPFLAVALRVPKLVVLGVVALAVGAAWIAKDFGSSFLPPFREDSFNVALSLPPGASLAETERVAESCVPVLEAIPGVLSVTRRTGRAERDQHAEPVSSSEYVVRVDLKGDTDAVRSAIRAKLGGIPGCSLLVGYPIAHRIGAVLSGTEAEVAVNVYGEDVAVLRDTVAKMKTALAKVPEVSDVRANREVTVRTLRIDYDAEALLEAGLTLREAGEQVAAAFNGVETGEVRDGLRKRAVTVRLAGGVDAADAECVKGLLLAGRNGKRVRLDDVAQVVPEESSNLMLREGGRRKALISCNASDGVNTGDLVAKLSALLGPIAASAGCSVEFGGSYQARESAGRRLAVLGVGLVLVVCLILVFALKSVKGAFLALLNVPLGLVGGVAAVAVADPVLSVSSLVGFVTVIGFVLRNGLLLLNCFQERLAAGADLETAIRAGALERMPPIVMTSLTTVFGLVPIMLAGNKPGGELLAPLAVVQFGGLLGATVLNLVVLPAAAKAFGLERVEVSEEARA